MTNKSRSLAIYQMLKGAGNTFSFEDVSNGLDIGEWEVHPVHFGNKIIGAIIQRGAELHTSIAPEFQKKWNPRPYIKRILYPALERYGKIESSAPKSDQRCVRWLLKLGFCKTSEDENFIYFELKNIKF